MDVLYLAHMTVRDGSSLCLLSLLDGLRSEYGINPLVVVPKRRGFLVDELKRRGIPCRYIRLACSCYPNYTRILDKLLFSPHLMFNSIVNVIGAIRLKALVHEKAFDIIDTNSGVLSVGYRVAKSCRIPHVWHLREYQGPGTSIHPFPSYASFRRRVNDGKSTVICASKGLARCFSEGGTTHVVYDGVRSLRDIHPIVNTTREKRFLFVGTLIPSKGLEDLIKAFGVFRAEYPEYSLDIAGGEAPDKGAFKGRLIRLIESLKLTDAICFLGVRSDVDALMQKARATVVASLSEGFGRVVPEAIINGCPVIGRDTTGTGEVMRLVGGGFLFETVEGLAEAMRKVATMSNDDLLACNQKAREKIAEYFTTEVNTRHVYDRYCNALKDHD